MESKIAIFFSFFLIFSCCNAFNITQILSQFKDFGNFNDYLTQTQLASEINSRQTITILAVDNSAMPSLSGRPIEIAKKIMSVHVVLDYYDLAKLQKMSNKTTTLTTLFQSSGQATGQQGFLNASVTSSGGVILRSLASGSTIGANVVKTIVSQPYNVSVLQISTAIVPVGIEGNSSSSSSNSTAPPPHHNSPVPAPGPEKQPIVAPTTPPKMAPTAPPPHVARAPPPAGAPDTAPVPADAPEADGPAADAEDGKKKKNDGVTVGICASSVFVVLASLVSSLVSIV